MDIPRWFLTNMFLRFGFSWCLQALVSIGVVFMRTGVKLNGA